MAPRRPATSGCPSDSAASSWSIASRLAKIAAARAPASRIGLGGLDGPAAVAFVRGDEREAAKVVATAARQVEPQRLGDATVEQAPPGQARRLVGEVAKTAMGEVEPGPALPGRGRAGATRRARRRFRPPTGRWRGAPWPGRTSVR